MARPAGVEPATIGLEVRYSIQLSYGRAQVVADQADRLNSSGIAKVFLGLSNQTSASKSDLKASKLSKHSLAYR